jgi:hypothetical protein
MDKLILTEEELCRLIIGQQSLMFHAHNRGEDPAIFGLAEQDRGFREAAAPKNSYALTLAP